MKRYMLLGLFAVSASASNCDLRPKSPLRNLCDLVEKHHNCTLTEAVKIKTVCKMTELICNYPTVLEECLCVETGASRRYLYGLEMLFKCVNGEDQWSTMLLECAVKGSSSDLQTQAIKYCITEKNLHGLQMLLRHGDSCILKNSTILTHLSDTCRTQYRDPIDGREKEIHADRMLTHMAKLLIDKGASLEGIKYRLSYDGHCTNHQCSVGVLMLEKIMIQLPQRDQSQVIVAAHSSQRGRLVLSEASAAYKAYLSIKGLASSWKQ